jgi:hypothetical protein
MKMIQHTEEKLKISIQEKRTQGQEIATFSNKVLQGTKYLQGQVNSFE